MKTVMATLVMAVCLLSVAVVTGQPGQQAPTDFSPSKAARAAMANPNRPLPPCPYTIPMLEYANDGLEPYLDARTVMLHRERHHQGYVTQICGVLADRMNFVILGGKFLRQILNFVGANRGLTAAVERTVRNQGGGHFNHCLYWRQFAPRTSNTPELMAQMELSSAIRMAFMNETNFRTQLLNSGLGVFGSGWAWLVVTPGTGRVRIISTPNQDSPFNPRITPMSGIPILGIDVWEHAYYLKYANVRADYIRNITMVINWPRINQWYMGAKMGRFPELGAGCQP